ncbi:glucose-6-phosphatase-like protein [Leptotrombidium deliense]|uniref:glucose-6-phosphatase n=1 Tax=Leptotrombidium deliense TaxID=299467 RepID=A0A443SUD3_9ACAR|nr:glucose-6-phosphatase-like protein [Leptotrombidium deliense]
MSLLDNFRFFELSVLSFIQQTLEPFGTLFITGCHVGDPRYPYVYFSIFLSTVGEHIAVKLLWAVIVSEWLNTLFKWILNDHRPYWWVNEYFSRENITLKQFDVTCETGPGNPSGHMMVTACVWFVVYKELTKKNVLNTVAHKTIALAVISFWLIVIAFGRMYISAHFPDQCLLGLIAGLSVGVLINRFVHLIDLKIQHHFLFSAFIISSLFITYSLLNAFSSVDANWSLKLASKWCVDINYVKPDTTPFFVLWRTSGAIIGTGIAFVFVHRRLRRTSTKIGKVYAVCFVQYMLVPINVKLLANEQGKAAKMIAHSNYTPYLLFK